MNAFAPGKIRGRFGLGETGYTRQGKGTRPRASPDACRILKGDGGGGIVGFRTGGACQRSAAKENFAGSCEKFRPASSRKATEKKKKLSTEKKNRALSGLNRREQPFREHRQIQEGMNCKERKNSAERSEEVGGQSELKKEKKSGRRRPFIKGGG